MLSSDVPIIRVSLKDYALLAKAVGATAFATSLETKGGLLVGWRFPKGCFVNKQLFLETLGRWPEAC